VSLHNVYGWARVLAKCHLDNGESALGINLAAVDLVAALPMSLVVHEQLGMLKGQHFGLGKAEHGPEELLNHRLLLHFEDLRTLAECSKHAVSTLVTHPESTLDVITAR
jgi:hypothetical protein